MANVPRRVLLSGELLAGQRLPLGPFLLLEAVDRRQQRLQLGGAGRVAVGTVASRRVLRRAGRLLRRSARKFRRSRFPRVGVLAIARRHGAWVVRKGCRLVRDLRGVRLVAYRLSRR